MTETIYKNTDCLNQIGETAGLVWQFLSENDAASYTKIIKSVDAPRDLVLQAIGWLAREGKLRILESKRGKSVSLVEREQIRAAA